jgi:MFS family permease
VGDIVAPRERGRYQSYIQSVFVLASVAGPLLGGVFVDHLSWRWVFYVNLPIGAVALMLLRRQPAGTTSRRGAGIDALGAGLLAAAVVSGMLLTVWGGDRYAWTSSQILGLAVVTLVLVTAFIGQERRAAEPVLPLRLFRDRVFVIVGVGAFLATLSLFGAIVFMPLFLQIVTGATATTSGLLMLPLLLASTVSTIGSGRIMARTGRYKVFPVVGFALMCVGLALLATLGTSSGRGVAMTFMAVFGLGFGLTTQVLIVAIQNAVDRREIGTATASINLFRALGGSVGVAVYGAVFAAGLRHWLPRHLPGHADGIDAHGIQASPERIRALPPDVAHGLAASVADALHAVFLVAAPLAAAGLLVVLFLHERPLRKEGQ